ncbi:hypothetical protein FSOLCH5_005712 [Fusarium solani]
MADEASNQDEGFGLPPRQFAREWLDIENPESLSAIETVMLSRFNYLAAQNQHIMLQLENLHLANSRSQSPRNNILSAAASTEGVDDTSIPSIPGDRVQEAFDELRTGELQRSSQPFTTHARTFIEHITQVIKEKQANPKGKAKAENAESPVSVRTDDSQ